jgi:exodeoxyribonuclease-5
MSKELITNDDIFSFLNEDEEETVADNELILPNGKKIVFNDQQFEAIQRIKKWLKEKDKTFFTLEGPAGSGKSTIIKKILDDYRYGVVVSAPTHKATRIIQNITEKESKTLHSLLGLRPDLDLENFSPNFPQFNPIALPRITFYSLVILDESSMVNQDLFNLIKEKTKDSRTKVLFVGDPHQLPPINEKESAVFIQEDIEKYILTEIMRQADTNPILLIADIIRNNLTSIDAGNFSRKTNININGEGIIFTIDKREFRKMVLEKFTSEEFNKDINFCRGIAWKNETVMQSNNVVRTAIFGNKADIIEVNDVICGYRTITNDRQNQIIIQNSADYRVIEKSGLEENSYGISGYPVKIREDLPKGKFKFEDVFIINTNNHKNLHLYAQMHDFFKDCAKSNKKMWNKYYEFRRNNLLMKNIDKYQNGRLRNSGEVIVKDLDYGYFLTCHKVQGSTYQHVTIILSDFEENWVLREKNQLFYTALTRPELTATILCSKIDE